MKISLTEYRKEHNIRMNIPDFKKYREITSDDPNYDRICHQQIAYGDFEEERFHAMNRFIADPSHKAHEHSRFLMALYRSEFERERAALKVWELMKKA